MLGAPNAIFTTGTQLNTLCSHNLTLFFFFFSKFPLSCLEGYWPFMLHPTQKNSWNPHILQITSPQCFYKLPSFLKQSSFRPSLQQRLGGLLAKLRWLLTSSSSSGSTWSASESFREIHTQPGGPSMSHVQQVEVVKHGDAVRNSSYTPVN